MECRNKDGLEHLAVPLGASRCVGLNSDGSVAGKLASDNHNPKIVYVHNSMEDYAKNTDNRFDCIMAVNALKVGNASAKLAALRDRLAAKGYICLAELLKADEVPKFEQELRLAGLEIVKTENLTRNALHALKILAKTRQAESCIF